MTKLLELRKKSKSLSPLLRIGKNGLTQGVVEELNKLLKKYPLIKVKMLRSALEGDSKKLFFQKVAEKTGSSLVDTVGLVAVLYKEPLKTREKKNLNTQKTIEE